MPTTNADVTAILAALRLRDRVEVQWFDAHNVETHGWSALEQIAAAEVICRVRTLGYFLCITQNFVVLAGDAQVPQPDVIEEYHSTSAIPIGCIESVTVFADE